ncbi:hypothetical protein [Streptomyces viridosporus]|uniref:hypothetical protein n=1 Tax=Streptomyces viridosporus TaxID=67581 RepID=UPI0036FA0FDD
MDATPTAGDLAMADWESFDPLRHHEHIHTRLPAPTTEANITTRAKRMPADGVSPVWFSYRLPTVVAGCRPIHSA